MPAHACMQRLLRELTDDDYRTDDGIQMQPPEVYSYLSRVMYNRRNKFDPLWNSLVVGGVSLEGEPFLVRARSNGCFRLHVDGRQPAW